MIHAETGAWLQRRARLTAADCGSETGRPGRRIRTAPCWNVFFSFAEHLGWNVDERTVRRVRVGGPWAWRWTVPLFHGRATWPTACTRGAAAEHRDVPSMAAGAACRRGPQRRSLSQVIGQRWIVRSVRHDYGYVAWSRTCLDASKNPKFYKISITSNLTAHTWSIKYK